MNGGLVYITLVIILHITLYSILFIFVMNTLCLYMLNTMQCTKRFINFYFICGEFVGNFIGFIVGCGFYNLMRREVFILDNIVDNIDFVMLYAFVCSLVLFILNMFLFTIRYRTFEYGFNFKSYPKKLWIRKSIVFGIILSLILLCVWIVVYLIFFKEF